MFMDKYESYFGSYQVVSETSDHYNFRSDSLPNFGFQSPLSPASYYNYAPPPQQPYNYLYPPQQASDCQQTPSALGSFPSVFGSTPAFGSNPSVFVATLALEPVPSVVAPTQEQWYQQQQIQYKQYYQQQHLGHNQYRQHQYAHYQQEPPMQMQPQPQLPSNFSAQMVNISIVGITTADLNFIRNELRRVMVILGRLQDKVESMNSTIQKYAHTMSKSPQSASSKFSIADPTLAVSSSCKSLKLIGSPSGIPIELQESSPTKLAAPIKVCSSAKLVVPIAQMKLPSPTKLSPSFADMMISSPKKFSPLQVFALKKMYEPAQVTPFLNSQYMFDCWMLFQIQCFKFEMRYCVESMRGIMFETKEYKVYDIMLERKEEKILRKFVFIFDPGGAQRMGVRMQKYGGDRGICFYSTGLQALASMVHFTVEFSRMSTEFDEIVFVTLDNYDAQGLLQKLWGEVVFEKMSSLKKTNSKVELVAHTSRIPSYWSRIFLYNMVELAKEETARSSVLEPLFHNFDDGNLWVNVNKTTYTILSEMQDSIKTLKQSSNLLLSLIVKHLHHKNVTKQLDMKITIIHATGNKLQTNVYVSTSILRTRLFFKRERVVTYQIICINCITRTKATNE